MAKVVMKKGKILLITPNLKGISDGVNRIQPSLGLMLIGPILEKDGHTVKIYDSALDGWNNRNLINSRNKIEMNLAHITLDIWNYNPQKNLLYSG